MKVRLQQMPVWLAYRFVVRRMLQNPLRLILVVAAVAAATTLIVSVSRVSISSVEAFEEALGYSANAYPLTVSPRGGRIPLDQLGECLAPLRQNFDIAALRRESGVISAVDGSHPISVVGVSATDDGDAHRTDNGAILLSERTMRELNVERGALLRLTVRGESIEGHVEVGTSFTDSLPSATAVVPLVRLTQLPDGSVIDSLLLRPRKKGDSEEYRPALTTWLSTCAALPVPIQVDTTSTRIGRGEELLKAYRLNVTILAGITLLVCVLLVSQATQLSLRNLSGELSILRTLGVGRVACVGAVIAESIFVAAIGSGVGVTLGEPVTLRLTALLLMTAHDIYNISLASSASSRLTECCAVVVGMVGLCTTAAIFGGLGALHVSPALGTRASFHHAQPIRSTWALPLALGALVLAVLVSLLAATYPKTWLAYLCVATSVAAVACTTPYAILVAPAALKCCGSNLFVWFARGAIQRNGRAFLFGTIGASVSITIICALTLMVGSFRSTLVRWSAQRLQGDLFISSAIDGHGNEGRLEPHLTTAATNLHGVKKVIPYYETMTSYKGAPLVVSASDTAAQYDRGIYVYRSGRADRGLLTSGRGALASESAARKLNLVPDDPITVDGHTFVITAIIQEFGTEHPLIHIDQGAFLSMYPAHRPENLTIDLREDASPDAVRAQLEQLVGALGVVRNNSELRDLVVVLFDRTFRITLSIRWIVCGIALLGVMLAAVQHLWERRREVKTMHVLGFAPQQIVCAQVAESTAVCTLPVFIGVLGGFAVGWALTELVNPRSFGWSLDFTPSITPALIAVGFIGGVAVVVGCATLVLIGRTVREATLSDE